MTQLALPLRPRGRMHAASLENSPRLQRVLAYLQEHPRGATTMEIIVGARVAAVNSCIDELRFNGYAISCTRTGNVWRYQLESQGGN